ncbi:hypothetical protein ABW19_dt0208019 [Dactylella cylindrospora]|nr:hypothetical protein ABW19_dt0208019 [Dactylella cylindrospora]
MLSHLPKCAEIVKKVSISVIQEATSWEKHQDKLKIQNASLDEEFDTTLIPAKIIGYCMDKRSEVLAKMRQEISAFMELNLPGFKGYRRGRSLEGCSNQVCQNLIIGSLCRQYYDSDFASVLSPARELFETINLRKVNLMVRNLSISSAVLAKDSSELRDAHDGSRALPDASIKVRRNHASIAMEKFDSKKTLQLACVSICTGIMFPTNASRILW